MMVEIGNRGTQEDREKMMNHALRDYDEQVVNAENEPEVRHDDPSAASGSNEPRDAAGRIVVNENIPASDADDEHEDADMGITELFQLTGTWDDARDLHAWGSKVSERKKGRNWDDDVKAMNDMLVKEGLEATVHEVYSPKRVNAMAEKLGPISGLSLDLTVKRHGWRAMGF